MTRGSNNFKIKTKEKGFRATTGCKYRKSLLNIYDVTYKFKGLFEPLFFRLNKIKYIKN